MKIVLDQRTCGCWDAPAKLTWLAFLARGNRTHRLHGEIIDDGKPERTFLSSTGMDLEKCWWWTTAIEKKARFWRTAWERQQGQPENSEMMRMAWLT
jgi:hypothetical protein